MSLCDACAAPGACCRRLQLFGQDGAPLTFWDDEPLADQMVAASAERLEFLLRPIAKETFLDEESGRSYSQYAFECTQLGADGRCLIYEHRPLLCRNYEPASDKLCVHYVEPEAA